MSVDRKWRGGPKARFSAEDQAVVSFVYHMFGVQQNRLAEALECSVGSVAFMIGLRARPKRHADASTQKRFHSITPENFSARLDKSGGPDACWPWTRGTQDGRYGAVGTGRRHQYAHRVAYELAFGSFDKSLFVCHRCDNPPCCNPAHLFLGTTTDNIRDMVSKSRHVSQYRPRGGRNVTAETVVSMRERFADGTVSLRELSKEFGLSRPSVSEIVRGITWRLVGGPRTATNKAQLVITDEILAIINARHAAGELIKDLAIEYGITRKSLSRVRCHRTSAWSSKVVEVGK